MHGMFKREWDETNIDIYLRYQESLLNVAT